MASSSEETCVLCKESDGRQMNVVGEKGLGTLINVSIQKEKEDLHRELISLQTSNVPILVHHDCRRRFIDPRARKDLPEIPAAKKLRSSIGTVFDWKNFCFLCERRADKRHRIRDSIREVQTIPIRSYVIDRAQQRNDEWGGKVLARMENCIDLVAAEAVYHSACMSEFRQIKGEGVTRGRPTAEKKMEAFESVCAWFESSCDSEMYSVQELYAKMCEQSSDDIYSMKAFREKLKARYEDHVYFIPGTGCHSELICFKDMTDFIIRKMKDHGETKESVIAAAAKLIKEDIRAMQFPADQYPNEKEICEAEESSRWVPESLGLLLSYLIPSSLKRLSVSQCIVQAARPRSVIAPIPFGVGVTLEKRFGSKWLVNFLSRLGFSITSEEVLRFKQSAVENLENELQPDHAERHFMQWVGDNVDHNLVTLTGKDTFHGMGIISVSSDTRDSELGNIPRLKERQKAHSVTNKRGVEIHQYYRSTGTGEDKLIFHPAEKQHVSLPPSVHCDLLWHCSWFFSSNNEPRPNWAGFMQSATSASTSEVRSKSCVTFLPMIDLNPNNEVCIYSTLRFVIDQAAKMQVQTPSITFDQPLWLKAMTIIKAEQLPVVCRLGGFHTLMSFLGSIGNLMKGSGLEELFEEVYAVNSVPHMMSGKAFSRALRAHTLAESALMTLLLEAAKERFGLDWDVLEKFYKNALAGLLDESLHEMVSSDVFTEMSAKLQEFKEALKAKSRTAKLWLLYMEYISIVKLFILAERTSNWELHLHALSQMLNLFASTGHSNYAKSARLYLQEMRNLPQTYPWLHDHFTNGQHTVRRTEKNWAGIWTDLAIEQTLMRSIKSQGGLTEGRGMTESVRHLWVLSLSSSANVQSAMMELTGAQIQSSEQHADLGITRRKHDFRDCQKFHAWLTERNPFLVEDKNLHSLSTGLVSIVGVDDVTCDSAEEIGCAIQQSFDGLALAKSTVKRKDLLKPLSSLQRLRKGKGTAAQIDNQVMFTRLIAVADRLESFEPVFEYELTPEPTALFREGLMRKPDKPSLRKVILPDETAIARDKMGSQYASVIDGGALLHRVRWAKGTKFMDVAKTYLNYLTRHYHCPTVVFDGYESATTKSQEHLRRNAVPMSAFVSIKENNEVPYTQDRYLSLKENKAEFIKFLSCCFRNAQVKVINCSGDADSEIVKEAINQASDRIQGAAVVVVADDTDIAVMLLYHWKDWMNDIYFLQERSNRAWSMKRSQTNVEEVKEHLLFLHSWSGCDTTSSIFGKGKGNMVNILKKSPPLQESSRVMMNPDSSQEEVGDASVTAFKVLYGGKVDQTLTTMR